MSFVEAEGHAHQSSSPLLLYRFPNQLFSAILQSLLSPEHDNSDLLSLFASSYMESSDVRYYTLTNMT